MDQPGQTPAIPEPERTALVPASPSAALAATPAEPQADEPFVRMTIGEHLHELRSRVIRGLIGLAVGITLAVVFGSSIMDLILRPAYVSMREAGYPPVLKGLGPAEAMMVYFKTCLMVGLVISAPYALWELWRFIAGGLYPHEQKYVRLFAPVSLGLFVVGAAFFYFVVLPVMLLFLVNFSNVYPRPSADLSPLEKLVYQGWSPASQPATRETATLSAVEIHAGPPTASAPAPGRAWLDTRNMVWAVVGPDGVVYGVPLIRQDQASMVNPDFRLSEYMDFVTLLTLVFGLVFQLPLVVVFVVMVRLVSVERLARVRSYVLFAIFVVAAVATPTTDPVSMLLMAVPMVALYEAGLVMARVLHARRIAAAADDDADPGAADA